MTTEKLANGMPKIGCGWWKVEKPQAAAVVSQAISCGYRHFDCACDYGNEAEIGQGLAAEFAAGTCKREDLWITSKLWNTYHEAQHVRQAAEKTLSDLQLDYLDLYLVHFPIATRFVPFDVRYPPEWFFDPHSPNPKMEPVNVPVSETWGAMEELQRAGLVKSIGVSNFNCQLLRDLLSWADIPPSVLQIESHPRLTQENLIRLCHDNNIEVTAFSPLGAEAYFSIDMATEDQSLLTHGTITSIASQTGRTAAQVLLRWGIQRGTAVIPKSANPQHLAENLNVFDFELDDAQMKQISDLNQNLRFNDPGVFCEKAFNTFFPIYE